MTSTAGQNDIYHARMVQVIGVTPGQNSTQAQGHSRTVYSQPQEGRSDLVSKDIHHRHQLDISSQQGKMGSDGDKTPPLPPRGAKCGSKVTSASERLSLHSGNRNFLTKYFEQNSYAQETKTVNGGVKQLRGILKKTETSTFQETEKGRETPPPKLPPRIRKRPVSYPSKEEAISPPNGIIRKETVDKHNGVRTHPQPLTKTNVTKHDQIWTKEEKEKPVNGVLSPPLNHITPESTEELWKKFDMLDVLDSASDHSDSSADTMIMMTTAEEEKNQTKITQSMQKYKTQKDEQTIFSNDMQIQFQSPTEPREADKKSTKSISQLSPKSEDTDDGYGTNSSQGTTVSSPLSSSLTSLNVISDTDISIVHGAPKLATATSTTQQDNSAIQNSSKTTWAVRRRTKMAEAKEESSSLQEQLRQLAIIEEEDNTQANDVSENSGDRVSRSRSSSVKMRHSPQNVSSADDTLESVTSDLEKFEGDLYDKMIDMDRNYRNYYGFDKDFDVKTEDSKVLYFQDKVLKQNYGSDNYYNPRGYYGKEYGDQSCERLGPPPMSSVGSLPRNVSLSRDYSSQESSSYRSNASSGVGSVDGRFYQLTNMSMDNIRVPKNLTLPGMPGKGHFSSSDNLTQNGRRPLFASSADIQKLFQTRDNISDQLQRPASCRHSFHAMPCTQQWIVDAQNQASTNEPRPRAASASVSSKSKSSWNPFGGMFSKKKNKSSGSNQDVAGKKSSTESQTVPPQKPIIKSGTNVSALPDGPLRRYAEKRGLEALPNGSTYDKPFRTVKHVAPSGTKLSTLV